MEIKRQQDKMKNMKSIWALCLCLMGISAFFSCTRELFDVENGTATPAGKFVLNVSTGNKTRVALGEDGMTMYWQPGDQLVMVNMETRDSIHLKTDITEPATEARFVSEVGVGTGNYYVLCNIDSKTLSYESKSSRLVNVAEGDSLMQNTESRQYKLYSTLHVNDGDTQKNIVLKHAYAKVRVELANSPFTSSQLRNICISMASANAPFSKKNVLSVNPEMVNQSDSEVQSQMNEDELHQYLENLRNHMDFEAQDYSFVQFLISGNLNENEYYTLLLPVDLRNQTVYFYVYENYALSSSYNLYEFAKQGIDLVAGGNYKITLDFNDANAIHLSKETDGWNVDSADDLRAVSIIYGDASITADIDCKDEAVFPLRGKICGHNHTISNAEMFSKGDNVALTSNTNVQDLKLENCSFKGRNYVSALSCQSSASNGTFVNNELQNCNIEGENYVAGLWSCSANSGSYSNVDNNKISGTMIKGNDYVGGLVSVLHGDSWNTTKSCSNNFLNEGCIIEGHDYVGGLAGESYSADIYGCQSFSSVKGSGDNIGGLVGRATYLTLQNGFNGGRVSGVSSVGGLIGWSFNTMMIHRCYNSEIIQGTDNVGGLIGYNSGGTISASYNVGTVSSDNIAGGLIGLAYYSSSISILKSYSIGKVDGTLISGGLVGKSDMNSGNLSITNCYVSAPVYTYVQEDGAENPYDNDKYALWKTISPDEDSDEPVKKQYVDNFAAYVGDIGKPSKIVISNCLTSQPVPMCQAANGAAITIDDVSKAPVTSIYNNLSVINGESAYSTAVKYLWDSETYPVLCPIHVWAADPIWGDVHMPAFGTETDWDNAGNSGTNP